MHARLTRSSPPPLTILPTPTPLPLPSGRFRGRLFIPLQRFRLRKKATRPLLSKIAVINLAQKPRPKLLPEKEASLQSYQRRQLVLHHGEIKDFMGPMTMGYQTESPSLLEGLKPGDRVRFSIDPQKKIIVKIEKIS